MLLHERRWIALQQKWFALTLAVWAGAGALVSLDYVQSAEAAPRVTEHAGPPAPKYVDRLPNPHEVLWLARCIYSETKLSHEQELVAWVVRNRVETRYRGKTDYRSVVLDPWQFSAFNADSPKRAYFMSLHAGSRARGFQSALRIARRVMMADESERPFPIKTRHFYSLRSMEDEQVPVWAVDVQPVALDRHVDPRRFQFFAQVV